MGKTSKRVISLILSVLMVLSMTSVFCLPTMSAPEGSLRQLTDADYDKMINGTYDGDVFIINKAWTAEQLVDGAKLTYYFRGQDREVTYNPKRHFNSWSACYTEYMANITADNIGSYIPTFIFAPGTYNEQINIHIQANILGSNAGINPNDTTEEWTADAMADGWNANAQWDTSKETLFDGGVIYAGTRESGSDGGDLAPKWAYFYEQYKSAHGNSPVTATSIVDGVVFKGSGRFNSNYWDSGKSGTYDSHSFTAGSGGTENVIIRNSYVRNFWRSNGTAAFDWNTGLLCFWDSSKKSNYGYFENVRFYKCDYKGMFAKYMKGIEFNGCYFEDFNNSNGRLFGDDVGSSAFGAGDGVPQGGEQTILLKHSVYANNNAWGPFSFGLNRGTATTLTFNVEDNIFYNPTKNQGIYGLFIPINKNNSGHVVNLNIKNNQFKFEGDASLVALANINPGYQQAKTVITVTGNKFLGNMTVIGGPNDAVKANLHLNYYDNYWAKTDGETGKPITFENNVTTGGSANNFDFAAAEYYLDYAMTKKTTLNNELTVSSAEGFGDGTEVVIGSSDIVVTNDGATGTVTPEIKAGESATVKIYSDSAHTTQVTQINYDAIGNNAGDKGEYYVRVEVPGVKAGTVYEKNYTLTVYKQKFTDFKADLEDGISDSVFGDFNNDNTAVYIEGSTAGKTWYYSWNKTLYKFEDTADDHIYGTLDELKTAVASNTFGSAPRVVMPAKEYGAFTIPFAASFYGTNFAVDPVDKSGAVNPEDEWRLNSDWGAFGETGVGKITIPAGVEGEINLIGITMRDVYTDSARNTDSGNLNVTFKNVVLDFKGAAKGQDYTFYVDNARSNTADAAFAATYNDSLIFENFFFKDLGSTGVRRFLSEKMPKTVTIKNMFWDGTKLGPDSRHGYIKNTTARGLSYTLENSMFVIKDNGNPLIMLQPVSAATNYNVAIKNNKFINLSESKETSAIQTWSGAADATSLEISGNTFVVKNGKGKAIYAECVDKNQNKLTAAGLTVKDNDFIGCNSDNFSLGTVKPFESSFYTKTFTYAGLVGENTGVEASDYYWLDMARTVKNTDFDITMAVSDETLVPEHSVDNTAKTITFRLERGGSTDSITITPAEGVAGTWLNQDGTSIDKIEFSENPDDATRTYIYRLTKGEYTEDFTVTVLCQTPKIFKDEYVCSATGLISEKALMVTSAAAGVETGKYVTATWDGEIYNFTAGVNAFATYAEALEYANTNITGVPEILVTSWPTGTDLTIDRQAKIFAPNYNTKPFITGEKLGVDSDGSDWAENPEYMANQVTVKSIVVAATVSGSADVYGFTFTGAFKDTARAESNTCTKVSLVNSMKNGVDDSGTGTTNYIFQVNNNNTKNVNNTDEFLAKNLYIKRTAGGTRLIGELVPSLTTFDGMWCDAKASGLSKQAAWIKSNANTFIFTIKNSNLRSWHRTDGNANGLIQMEGFTEKTQVVTADQTRQYVYDNNILHEFGNQTGASGAGPWYMIRWYPSAFNGMIFTNNFVDAGENIYVNAANEGSRDTVNFFHSGVQAGVDLTQVHGSVVITGNTFNGASLGIISDDGKGKVAGYDFTVENNFLVENRTDDLANAVGDYPYINTKHHATIGTFWKDYARTIPVDAHKVYEYTLKNDGTKYFVNAAQKELQYKLDAENDPNVTKTAVEGGYKYDINMTGFVESNLYNNITLKHGDQSIKMSYGSAHTPHTGKDVLSFTSAEELQLPIVLDMEVASPDSYSGTAGQTEKYKLYISDVADGGPLVSVDVTWGSMEFTYSDGEWNTETHKWDGRGWTAAEGSNVITVQNSGIVNVKMQLSYSSKSSYESLNGAFADSDDTPIDFTSPVSLVAGAPEQKFKLNLSGTTDTRWIDNYIPVGTVTLTLTE